MNFLKKIAILLNIQPGEGSLVTFLLINSFFAGFTQTLLLTTSTTLFLEVYDSKSLPYVYISSALLVPLLGGLYTLSGKRIKIQRKVFLATICVFFVLVTFWLLLSSGARSKQLYLFLYVWYFVQNLFLINIEFWGTANRLLNVRQAKRLFGVITVGEISARILTGLSIKWLIDVFGGIHQLLLPAMFGVFLIIFLLICLELKPPIKQPIKGLTPPTKHQKYKDNRPLLDLFRNPYIVLVLTMSMFTIMSYYFVDLNYLTQTKLHIIQEAELASFIGLFSALSGLMTLIISVVFAGPLITRFGVTFGLLTLPLMTGLGVVLIIMTSTTWQVSSIFYLSVLVKLFHTTFNDSTAKVSSKILLKPLLPGERYRADVLKTIALEPVFTGVVGFALLKLPYSAMVYSYILLSLVFIWFLVIFFLRREYTTALKRALGLRVLGGGEFHLEDAQSKSIIQTGLESDYAGEVIYMLDLLDLSQENVDEEKQVLLKLLDHPAWEVREEAVRRIEQKGFVEGFGKIRKLLWKEEETRVRGACLRALSVLGGSNTLDEVQEVVRKSGWEEREEAIIGQLKSGEIEGVLWGGKELLKLENSDIVEERIHVARIIGKAGIQNFYRPLERMMKDDNRLVQTEAIRAAGKLQKPYLWEIMIRMLQDESIRERVKTALVDGGEPVIDTIEQLIDEEWLGMTEKISLLQVCGRIRNSQAVQVIKRFLSDDNLEILYQVIESLQQCGYRATGKDVETVKKLIKNEISRSTLSLAIILDLENQEDAMILCRGLRQRHKGFLRNTFSLLSFLYEPSLIEYAWNIFNSREVDEERKANALEALDETIGLEFKPMLFPLIETLPDAERLRKLNAIFPQKKRKVEQRLQEIILSSNGIWRPWVKACSLWVLKNKNPHVYEYHLRELLEEQDYSVYARYFDRGDGQMLSIIEKVIILKTVNIFSELPDEVLADIASSLEEVVVAENETLFKKGDIGDSMYIIVRGEMLVHDGAREIARRGEREIIGEMALLDPQPRSASITALKDALLLKLEEEVFYDLITDRSEVTRAVIRMLTRRLREAGEK